MDDSNESRVQNTIEIEPASEILVEYVISDFDEIKQIVPDEHVPENKRFKGFVS